MQYVIEDEYIIDLDVQLKQLPEVDMEIVLPVITLSNDETPEISEIEFGSVTTKSIDLSFTTSVERAEEAVKGIIYSENEDPTFESDSYKIDYGTGRFDLTIAGLRYNTTYFFKPYALSNLGYKYGNVQSCKTAPSPIPSEYQLVEYIEATGTQYIDIPYFLASGNTIEMELVNKNTGNDNCFIGGNQGGNRFYAIYDYPAGQFDLGYVSNNSIQGFTRQERMVVKAVMEVGNQQLFKNGNQIYQGYNQTIINLPNSLKIFCLTQGGSNSKGECYRVVVSKNNQIDLNLYPVYRKNDNKPGLYDIVNNAFHTNAGTGEFIVGPDKDWDE